MATNGDIYDIVPPPLPLTPAWWWWCGLAVGAALLFLIMRSRTPKAHPGPPSLHAVVAGELLSLRTSTLSPKDLLARAVRITRCYLSSLSGSPPGLSLPHLREAVRARCPELPRLEVLADAVQQIDEARFLPEIDPTRSRALCDELLRALDDLRVDLLGGKPQ